MSRSVATLNSIRLHNALSHGRELDIPEYTTINEIMDDASEIPHQPSPANRAMQFAEDYNFLTDKGNIHIQYLAIGRGGHYIAADDFKNYDKLATMNALYEMIPWVVRPIGSDLTLSQRNNYRLRKTLLINGAMYAAYYLRKLDMDSASEQNNVTIIDNGHETTYSHTPTQSDLKPQPYVSPVNPDNDGSFVTSNLIINLDLTVQDIQWIKDGCALIYGDENKAIISEIAVCSGVDKPVTLSYSNSTTPVLSSVAPGALREAVAVQVCAHLVDVVYVLRAMNTLTLTLDVGGSEPLLGGAT